MTEIPVIELDELKDYFLNLFHSENIQSHSTSEILNLDANTVKNLTGELATGRLNHNGVGSELNKISAGEIETACG